MTAPTNLEDIVPSKAKTWVGLVGAIVTFVAPLALSVSDSLPSPWPAVIGAVLAVLTALGIYKAPYKPADTVLAPNTAAVAEAARVPADEQPAPGQYIDPWK